MTEVLFKMPPLVSLMVLFLEPAFSKPKSSSASQGRAELSLPKRSCQGLAGSSLPKWSCCPFLCRCLLTSCENWSCTSRYDAHLQQMLGSLLLILASSPLITCTCCSNLCTTLVSSLKFEARRSSNSLTSDSRLNIAKNCKKIKQNLQFFNTPVQKVLEILDNVIESLVAIH